MRDFVEDGKDSLLRGQPEHFLALLYRTYTLDSIFSLCCVVIFSFFCCVVIFFAFLLHFLLCGYIFWYVVVIYCFGQICHTSVSQIGPQTPVLTTAGGKSGRTVPTLAFLGILYRVYAMYFQPLLCGYCCVVILLCGSRLY